MLDLILDAMTWHVQYRDDAVHHIVHHPSPEQAIEAACRLIDDGCCVYGIGTGPLTDSIGRAEIDNIHALWARARLPLRVATAERFAAPSHQDRGAAAAGRAVSAKNPRSPAFARGRALKDKTPLSPSNKS